MPSSSSRSLATDVAALLPRLTPDGARCARLVHDTRLAPLWRAAAGSQHTRLARAEGPGTAPLYRIELACDSGHAMLALSCPDEALQLVAASGPALRAHALPLLLPGPLEVLRAHAFPGLQLRSLESLPPEQAPHGAWCALRRDGHEWGRLAAIALPPGFTARLETAQHSATGQRRLHALRVRAAARMATRVMPLAALRSLERGDVLLFPPRAAPGGPEGHMVEVRFGQAQGRALACAGRMTAHSITLLGGLRTMDHDDIASGHGAAALDALELPVHFELETVSIPLRELEALEPGYVLELASPTSDARLRLVCCGEVIGEADLVAIGGRLGARITHLVPRHDA